MATTTNAAFSDFNTNIINLNSDRTTKARSSRDWLFGQLNCLDTKDNLYFPLLNDTRHIRFGSFARNTKIKPLDDIDLLLCLSADGATYLKNGDTYEILTADAGIRLKNLSSNDVLSSRRVINKLISSLTEIEQYKAAQLHRRAEAATLSLKSYEWVFDIVPCFYTDTQLYLIPDGNGNWKATDPRVDQSRVTTLNQANNGRALQLIRTLKYWNQINSTHTIPSYLFEQFVLDYISQQESLGQWIDFEIRSFFQHLSWAIYNSLQDPKGIQGDLNFYDYSQRYSISQKATWAYNKAQEAISAEIDEKNQKKSINIWREIFGGDFPVYG